MSLVNSNNAMNFSSGGIDNYLDPDGDHEHSLEAYTVVLSAATHILSTVFGAGSSIAVIIAITSHANIEKCSYVHVLALFLTCCCLNLIWSPLEVLDLIFFHLTHTHPFEYYITIKTCTYLFLIILICFIVVLLSIEGIMRIQNCFGKLLRKIWPLFASILALVCSGLITAIVITKCLQSADLVDSSFFFVNSDIRFLVLLITALTFCVVMAILILLSITIVCDAVYCEDGRLHRRQKKLKLTIPEFLISQSNACADNDGGYEHSRSGTPSPSTPKLLSVGNPETSSMRGGDDSGPISDLPSPMVKPTGNRLGINMAQVLGRRRHTICQISDSTGPASTSSETASKPKQYNYVRKFSVDICALQAQLQNPKIFKDAPFQSDMDLSKKQTSEKAQPPKPLAPLKPLTAVSNETEARAPEDDKNVNESSSSGGSTKNPPPPPVIMVFNDDAPPTSTEGDVPNDMNGFSGSFHEQPKPLAFENSVIQKPTTLTFKESTEEHFSVPALDSAVSDPSDAEADVRKMARLALFLSLTFLLNILPVLATEVLESRISEHAFINIITCTIAVSSIQTIVYPHLITCCDDVVHRAVQKLKKQTKNACSCRGEQDAHSQVEDSSSTSQV